jgi:hypothetical protein
VKVLTEQARGRLTELLALRYGRMLVSPFSFYRGAAAIMANDLAGTPTSGFHVQLCGDAHLSNFGTFSSPERELLFDISDFDETLPGPWEWDVKRLAASVCIAGRDREFGNKDIAGAVLATVAAYRKAMNAFTEQGNLDVWYGRVDVDELSRLFAEGVDVKRMKVLERELERGRLNTCVKALGKLTTIVDGKVCFLHKPPLLVPVDNLLSGDDREDAEDNLKELLTGYRNTLSANRRTLLEGYRYGSMARKVVGVGSVGMRVWVILLHGRDGRDPLLLQAKEANTSVLEEHLGPSATGNHAARVVEGQQLMQAASDIFLGWLSARGLAFGSRAGRRRARLLRAPGGRRQGGNRRLGAPAGGPGRLRPPLRMDARPRPRAGRRPHRDLRLPRPQRCVRPGDRGLRRALRRPERGRLQGAAGCGSQRPGASGNWLGDLHSSGAPDYRRRLGSVVG